MKPGQRSRPKLIGLAFRNLARHKVKTALTVTAVALGIVAYLYIDAFIAGVNTESRRNLVNYEMGAATIYSRAYWENKDDLPLYEGFRGWQPIREALLRAGYDAVPRATFSGTLLSREEELPFLFHGVDPALEGTMFLYPDWIERGDSDTPAGRFPADGAFEILLGVRGAKDLGVGVGDSVRLSTVIDKRDEQGIIRHINQVLDLRVCGIVNSPDPVVNGYTGFLPLGILQDDLGILLEGSVTELILATDPNLEGEATATYLARLVKPLGLKVTRPASGLPVGGDLEYADEVTLGRAFEGRRLLDV